MHGGLTSLTCLICDVCRRDYDRRRQHASWREAAGRRTFITLTSLIYHLLCGRDGQGIMSEGFLDITFFNVNAHLLWCVVGSVNFLQ